MPDLFDGLPFTVLAPRRPAPGRPWAWRPEFLGAFDAVDRLLVEAGWHLLFLDLPDHYGAPSARARFGAFIEAQIAARALAPSGVFIGLSRGGLSALHLACDRPELCAALYLDNPVCDFRSWPGGFDGGFGSAEDWAKLLRAHGFDERQAIACADQPLTRLAPALARRLPLALVGGDADEVVPWATNGARLAELYRTAVAPLLLRVKPGALHHPHGPDDPAEIADFLRRHPAAVTPASPARVASPADRHRWLEIAASLSPRLVSRESAAVGAARFIADASAFQGWRAEPAGDFRVRELAEGDTLDLDFGTHHVGRPVFEFSAAAGRLDAPLRLRILLGEMPLEIAAPREPFHSNMLCRSWLQEETLHLDELPARVASPRRYAFRYVRLEIAALSPGKRVRLDSARVVAEAATFTSAPPPATLDARSAAIDAIAVRTLQNCLHGVFEDGPKRDRRLWLGDLRLQALANSCTLRRFDLVKRCLLLFAGLARPDGLVEACIYHNPQPEASGNLMADYALFFVPTLLDYARHSGDLATTRDLWPLALHQVDTIAGALDAEGRLPEGDPFGWIFIDWQPPLNKAGPFLGLALYCVRQASCLAEVVADAPAAARLRARADTLAAIARRRWRDAGGRFADPRTGQRSLALTAWMILGGATEGDEARAELRAALADRAAIKPAGPYLWHHVIHACHLVGEPALGRELMERYWGTMLDLGADTFWEVFQPGDAFASPYENAQLNSYCHAWSCTPSWFLRAPHEAARA